MTTAQPTDAPDAAAAGRRDDAPPPATAARRKKEGTGFNVFSHGFLVLWAVMAAGPLLWALMSSFKTSAEILKSPWSLPDSLHWQNWTEAWSTAHIGQYTMNSAIIVACTVTGTMLFGSMAAYVLARFSFPGNRLLYFLFIGGMTFPVFMALVPLFFVMQNFGILNTRLGLILVYIAYSMPFTVFFMTAFFRTLPSSIAEAAEIDGASQTRTFFQVMLPMAKPGLISIGIFNFLGQWNQYVLPFVLNTDEDQWVLPQGIAALAAQQGYDGDWGALFAGLTLATLPILTFYILFQRQVQAGMTAGALK
ncbi:carbohydrate ABC transporter permease [Streptomyces sp. JJ36]|uniref:carbohydrate ABC transporter permease n=1 Tax=Streptomyces sp. JJ36 TaxID=2736645 RepID=UPI001F41ABD1|nr:carbohydrate ABC transporter permease [Streptomyces sp. JJ36]MCF6522738.1 carbohydrate ABC transporter permease [Streptomyces sp. JJ36]